MTEPAACPLEFAGLSDVGRTRSRNEDSFAIDRNTGVALVCDGMGGHAGGDIASQTAIRTIIGYMAAQPAQPLAQPPAEPPDPAANEPANEPDLGAAAATIRAAVQQANHRLVTANLERGYPEGRGMGTTAVGLWHLAGTDTVVVFHVGDSRLYRLRGDEFRQITRDHSLYQAWLDGGGRGYPPHRNIITRALGTASEVEADLSFQLVAPGDLFLICSDGLSSMVSDADIAEALHSGADDLPATCARLVALANQRGGLDNVTVVLAHARG
jgi:protein phosphatase